MSEQLDHLASLPITRAVANVTVALSTAPSGGLLLKLGMATGYEDTIVLDRGAARGLFDTLLQLESRGRLAALSDSDDDALLAAVTPVQADDWRALGQKDKTATSTRALSTPQGLGIELVMQTGDCRQFWLASPVARFLSDYLKDYRDADTSGFFTGA